MWRVARRLVVRNEALLMQTESATSVFLPLALKEITRGRDFLDVNCDISGFERTKQAPRRPHPQA